GSNWGSALPNMQMETGLLVVPTASLDSNVQIPPPKAIFIGETKQIGMMLWGRWSNSTSLRTKSKYNIKIDSNNK
ncbi:MAG TPA: hypothetical protein PLF65_00650, partial [Desulfobacter postgatei]|nr:hypothetical protein [Desulfobacter postgatei]